MPEKYSSELALFETILDSIDEGIHVVDSYGRTIFYNRRAAAIDGVDPEEVLGKHIFDIYPSLTEEVSTLITTLRSAKPTEERQQTFINKKGKKITTINRTIPVRLQDDSFGALEISREITQLQNMANKISHLQKQLQSDQSGGNASLAQGTRYSFDHIIGSHPEMRQAIEFARKAAETSSPVLLYGETGTGKEVFAQSIHNASLRREKPFIAQNCAALPRELLESLLFGTEKGSFTGATRRTGLFEQAHGGTLLLDEINSLDIDLQAKLLRVLQDGRIRRIGGHREKEIDVRILATSNVPPEQALHENQLRHDLFYRLSVVLLRIPPLRNRLKTDLQALVNYFIHYYNQRFHKQVQGVSEQLLQLFYTYPWPGNVRELQHLIEGAFNLIGHDPMIQVDHLPHYLKSRLHYQDDQQQNLQIELQGQPLPKTIEQVEQQLIQSALEQTGGNISQAARILQIKRQALQYKIKKYQLEC